MPHVTSPTWGPPPSCKQTLISFAAVFRLVTITATKETKVNRVCSTVTLPMEFVNFTGRQILQLRTQRSSESTLRFFLKNGNCVLLNLFWLIQESPNYQRAAIYALEICSLAGRVPTELFAFVRNASVVNVYPFPIRDTFCVCPRRGSNQILCFPPPIPDETLQFL